MTNHPTPSRSRWTVRMLTMGAMCMALSSVLSLITLFSMHNGGSVTPASMLPLMLFAYVYGPVPGIAVGALYGVLQYLLGGYFLSVPQVLLDYPVAYAAMGLAGLFWRWQRQRAGLACGILLASVVRYVVATLAGVLFWSDLTGGAWPAIVYSLGYNASYMLPECVICVALGLLVGPRLARELRRLS